MTMRKFLLPALLAMTVAAASAEELKPVKIECGPWVMNVTENEMTVVWITTDRALGWVETAPDDGTHFYGEERPRFYEDYLGRHVVSKVHHVRITGLEPGTTYRFRIFQQAIDDNRHNPIPGPITASDVHKRNPFEIRTLDKSKKDCRFVVVNDIHSRDSILHSHGQHVLDFNPDFVVFNGDMTSSMGSYEDIENGYLKRAVKDFASNLPLFYVRGNHEGRGRGASEFMNLFPTSTGLPYYMFRQGPVAFVVLDSGEDKPDSAFEYGCVAAYDAYREQEAEWLREVVKSEEFASAPVKIALLHVPPEKGDGWWGSNELKRLLIPPLEEAGVHLMLSGHVHRHSFRKPGECDTKFPVITNSNNDRLEVNVTEERIVVDVIDPAGKKIHQHTINL